MNNLDPFDADETVSEALAPDRTAANDRSRVLPLAGRDVLGGVDVDVLVAEVSANLIAQHITDLTRAAVDVALTPERIAVLEEHATAAVEKAFEPAGEEEAGEGLVFGSVDEWLRKYWRFTYRRRVSGKGSGTGRWKAVWWNTDEAVQRLESLWRGWEAARLDPGLGTSTWWINHATPHMNALLAIDGPFAGSIDENEIGDPLPYAQPPAHRFPSDKQAR